jgi:endonuclease V-like protein UPF0215 family
VDLTDRAITTTVSTPALVNQAGSAEDATQKTTRAIQIRARTAENAPKFPTWNSHVRVSKDGLEPTAAERRIRATQIRARTTESALKSAQQSSRVIVVLAGLVLTAKKRLTLARVNRV